MTCVRQGAVAYIASVHKLRRDRDSTPPVELMDEMWMCSLQHLYQGILMDEWSCLIVYLMGF